MKCYNCGQLLPDDSQFCQYCGGRLDNNEPIVKNKVSQEEVNDISIIQDEIIVETMKENKKDKKAKVRFCKLCGNQVDCESKKCTGCGKQYLRGNHVISLILVFIIIVLSCIVVALSIENNDNIDEWHYWKEKYNNIYKEYDFYHKHAVVVFEGDNRLYHRYDCSQRTSTVWIYNSEAAKGKGYSPCSNCFSKGSFNINGSQY